MFGFKGIILLVLILFLFNSCGEKEFSKEIAINSKICIEKKDKILFSHNTLGQVDNYFALILGDESFKFFISDTTCNIYAKVGNNELVLHTKYKNDNFENCLDIKEVELTNKIKSEYKLVKKDENIEELIKTSSKLFRF